MSLLPHHQQLITDSGIAPEVAEARGYESVTQSAVLKGKGFSPAQSALVPALLIPIHDVNGEIRLNQIRPDHPCPDVKGKTVKYQTPARQPTCLDVPPGALPHIGNPDKPLWITEGSRKADSALSHGIECCVSVMGVWSWKGKNETGGKTVLTDFHSIALNGRTVYLCFDADMMEKRMVHQALAELKRFLESRKAQVKIILLPSSLPTVNGESPTETSPCTQKVGLDDYLASGGTVEALIETAVSSLPTLPDEEGADYLSTPEGLFWNKSTRDGFVRVPLTNCTARIIREIEEDDGAETRRQYEIEARLKERTFRFTLPVAQFAGMNWASEHLGARALVFPGFSVKDHARFAIQLHSEDIINQKVYGHTGWREVGEEFYYLHAGGAIGRDGPIPDIQVNLGNVLSRYVLPESTAEGPASAVQSSLQLLEVAQPSVTYPLYAAIWRAALGTCDFSLHLTGPTGVAKSELSSLALRHYGPGLDARHLPASWSSTDNALEGLAFLAKDTLFCIDDFAPAGTQNDVQQLHRKADRVFRGQGNHVGRERMRSDSTLRPSRPPRGLILSSGEDIPKGHSLRARLLVLEVEPGTVDWNRLTPAQDNASTGVYAQAMVGFLMWMAPRYHEIHTGLTQQRNQLRDYFIKKTPGGHKRTPSLFADLALGFQYYLQYARQLGALTPEEASAHWRCCLQVFAEVSQAQSQHQAENEPSQRFLTLLSSALASGRAHVANLGGEEPEFPDRWGWRLKVYGGGEEPKETWTAQGERVGWVHNKDLYLEADAAYAVVQRLARDSGDSLLIPVSTLKKRLYEMKLLASVDQRGGRIRYQVRKQIQGDRREVLHLRTDRLTAETVAQVSQVVQDGSQSPDTGLETDGDEPQEWDTDPFFSVNVARHSGPTVTAFEGGISRKGTSGTRDPPMEGFGYSNDSDNEEQCVGSGNAASNNLTPEDRAAFLFAEKWNRQVDQRTGAEK